MRGLATEIGVCTDYANFVYEFQNRKRYEGTGNPSHQIRYQYTTDMLSFKTASGMRGLATA